MKEPTRVLQVVTHMNRGGLETMLMNYYRQIDREQVQFDFLTHREYQGDYYGEIQQLGGKVYHLPRLNPFSNSYKQKLGDFFDKHPEYRIIHVHQDCLSGVILKVAKEHGVKVRIAHSHSASQDKDWKYLIKLPFRHMISQYATKLFACSDAAGNWMFCGADFTVLNNAIDSKKYIYDTEKADKIRQQLGISKEEIVLGHVGRFSTLKNHVFLVDVFYELQKTVRAKLLLVGNDQAEDGMRIHAKVQELGLSDKVIFTGLRSDVADLMQAMDVFVFPSLYEGLPVTLIEAQSSGLPCVISDKVPIECKKTDLVQQLALSCGARKWSEFVLEATTIKRKNTVNEIKQAGFDIGENAKRLQEYYIDQYKKVE